MAERSKGPWTMTPAEEYRAMAKDCVEMGRPDFAVQFQMLAAEAERLENPFAYFRGHDQ